MKTYAYVIASNGNGQTLLWSSNLGGWVTTFTAADFWLSKEECEKYIKARNLEFAIAQKIEIRFVEEDD